MSSITNNSGAYRVSNSEIQTFKDCRRKWWLAYDRKLKPKNVRVSGPLALGSRVHNALEEFYENDTDLVEAYTELVEKDKIVALTEGLDIEELESEAEMGRIMLEGYLEWLGEEGIDADYDIISNEQTLVMPIPIPGKNVELQGKLDMRVRRKSDGTRLIRDFKTVGQSFDQFTSTLHLNEQVLTYLTLEAYHNTENDRSDGAIFTLFKKNKRTARAKPPFYAQEEILHNVFTLRSFWLRLYGVVNDLMNVKEAIEQGEDHRLVAYPRPSGDCRWKCEFFSICHMIDDGSDYEDAIADHFQVGNPNERYEEKKESE